MEKRIGTSTEALRDIGTKDAVPSDGVADLLAVASHEIRTPLGAVMTTAEALLQSGLDDQQTKYATTLRDAATALLVLSNSLLDATAATEFDEEVSFFPADLLESIVSLYAATAAARGLNLDMMCTVDRSAAVSGYPHPVRQVLTNLIDNAIKYTSAGRVRMHLAYLQETREIDFRVEDSGPGIADGDRERIFDPYARMNRETERRERDRREPQRRVPDGHGLGLWVARRTAEKLHGRLFVESSGPEGTVFRFVVPAGFDASPPAHPEPATSAPEHTSSETWSVLVVDDNPAALRLAEVVMAAFGWSVTTASSGSRALAAIGEARFDCVLTDLTMPGMNGIALAEAVARQVAPDRVPVLAVSADPPSLFGAKAGDNRLAGYVPKPYTPDLLYRSVVDAIRSVPVEQ